MMSLAELEQFIKSNHHLPGIPSANSVGEQGSVDLGEMNTLLLQKIEEMTLRMIEMEKMIIELREVMP